MDYATLRPQLEGVLNEVRDLLNRSLGHLLYRLVYSRVKSVESVNRKLATPRYQGQLWTDLPDYCGLAVIVHPLHTVEQAVQEIQRLNCWQAIIVAPAGNQHPAQFGYRAVHIDAVLRADWRNPDGNPIDPF